MKLVHGVDMFKEPVTGPTTFCVTTNGVVRPAGNGGYELVMGAGAALSAKNYCPQLPYLAADAIKKLHRDGWMGYCDEWGGQVFKYHLQNVGRPGDLSIGFLLVQTKLHWKEKSEPAFVKESLRQLGEWAAKHAIYCADLSVSRKPIEFRLNYPAIGRGGLSKDIVRPWVEALPDNVTVYEM